MAYSEELAEWVRDVLSGRGPVGERKMFGGICFMVDGNLAVCVTGEDLLVRVGREDHDAP